LSTGETKKAAFKGGTQEGIIPPGNRAAMVYMLQRQRKINNYLGNPGLSFLQEGKPRKESFQQGNHERNLSNRQPTEWSWRLSAAQVGNLGKEPFQQGNQQERNRSNRDTNQERNRSNRDEPRKESFQQGNQERFRVRMQQQGQEFLDQVIFSHDHRVPITLKLMPRVMLPTADCENAESKVSPLRNRPFFGLPVGTVPFLVSLLDSFLGSCCHLTLKDGFAFWVPAGYAHAEKGQNVVRGGSNGETKKGIVPTGKPRKGSFHPGVRSMKRGHL